MWSCGVRNVNHPSPLPSTLCKPLASIVYHQPDPIVPRLLALPHQMLQSIHALSNEIPSCRVPQDSQQGETRGGGAGTKDSDGQDFSCAMRWTRLGSSGPRFDSGGCCQVKIYQRSERCIVVRNVVVATDGPVRWKNGCDERRMDNSLEDTLLWLFFLCTEDGSSEEHHVMACHCTNC